MERGSLDHFVSIDSIDLINWPLIYGPADSLSATGNLPLRVDRTDHVRNKCIGNETNYPALLWRVQLAQLIENKSRSSPYLLSATAITQIS